ncbi:MAG TPA: DeoR/GlpR family transcriptional regulator [Candidatus Competibacteraceae bacterium]|nr:DeoR/GlpR family transcriptional regulator [Candidatus Competibacteraceae bacterium]
MSLNRRQQEVLNLVRAQGFVSIDVLAEHFQVTPQTIRRDVNALCEHGLLRRYHGGAGLPSSVENIAYKDRKILYQEEKQRIAATVARHIPDQASLFINLGTTTEAVAKALCDHRGLRVITNNLNVAALLSANPDFEVIIAGGVVRARDQGITGEATIDFISQFKVDYGIIGISGIDLDGTLRDFDYREVRVAEAIIQHSRKVFLVADHSKFGRNALVKLGHLSQIDALFTDRPPPPEMAPMLAEARVRVFVAGEGSSTEVRI